MKEKCGKVFERIVSILIIIVIIAILFCLYNFISLKVFKNDYVNIFGYSFFEVATGSMHGEIEEGDAVIIKINDSYKVGDIVTYQSGKDFITHRIIEDNGDYVITKGDANNTNDNPIDKKLILGKVIKIIPNVKTIKKVILSPKVIILIFVTLFSLSLLFSYEGQKIKITVDKEDKKSSKGKVKEDNVVVSKEEIKETPVKLVKTRKKRLDVTQVINIADLKQELPKKKKLEVTQVIDLKAIKR